MSSPAPPEEKKPFSQRARSVPYRHAFFSSAILCAITFLCVIGTIAALVSLIKERSAPTGFALAGFVVVGGLFWFLSYLKRRQAVCPLCRGTPLLDNRAHHHDKAVRFAPLNYGTTNVVRLMATLQFRCHLCGTPFDLLKSVQGRSHTPKPAALAPMSEPDFTKPSPVTPALPHARSRRALSAH